MFLYDNIAMNANDVLQHVYLYNIYMYVYTVSKGSTVYSFKADGTATQSEIG